MRYVDGIARLRVAIATGCLPADLGAWALRQLEENRPHGACLAVRDARLREAAALLSGSTWAKAERLEREAEAILDGEDDGGNGVRALVRQAIEAAPVPRSARHLFRILAGN